MLSHRFLHSKDSTNQFPPRHRGNAGRKSLLELHLGRTLWPHSSPHPASSHMAPNTVPNPCHLLHQGKNQAWMPIHWRKLFYFQVYFQNSDYYLLIRGLLGIESKALHILGKLSTSYIPQLKHINLTSPLRMFHCSCCQVQRCQSKEKGPSLLELWAHNLCYPMSLRSAQLCGVQTTCSLKQNRGWIVTLTVTQRWPWDRMTVPWEHQARLRKLTLLAQ